MSDKTERATPFKLKKAKEQGKVSKSTELNISLFLLVMLVVIFLFGGKLFIPLQTLLRQLIILSAHHTVTLSFVIHLQQKLLGNLVELWLPFALIGCITLVALSLLQTGFIWSTTPLIPDVKRLNMAQGMKQLFSSKTLIHMTKYTLKLLGVGVLLYVFFQRHIPTFLSFGLMSPPDHLPLLLHYLMQPLLQLALLLSALSFIDLLYIRWSHAKNQRMSKQEVKDEYKQREGDPKIKAKIKQLQHKLRQTTASLAHVSSAHVVVTNPTHLAIALQYERGLMPAPKVVCKAQGDLARQVKSLAIKQGIPIIEHKPFARALFQNIDLHQWITPDLFPIAAEVFRTLYQQQEKTS